MAATLTLDFVAVSPDADGDLQYLIEATPQQSAGRSRAPAGRYALIAHAPAIDLGGAGGDPLTWDVLSAYVARFGALKTTAKIFFRITVMGVGSSGTVASKGTPSLSLEFSKIVS